MYPGEFPSSWLCRLSWTVDGASCSAGLLTPIQSFIELLYALGGRNRAAGGAWQRRKFTLASHCLAVSPPTG